MLAESYDKRMHHWGVLMVAAKDRNTFGKRIFNKCYTLAFRMHSWIVVSVKVPTYTEAEVSDRTDIVECLVGGENQVG